MIRKLCLILSLLGCSHSQAQQQAQLLLRFGMGYTRAFQLDEYQSQLVYDGHYGAVSLGIRHYSNKWFEQLQVGGFGGWLSLPNVESSTLNDVGGSALYELEYQVYDSPKWGRMYAGLSNFSQGGVLINNRFSNNAYAYSLQTSIGIGIHAERDFEISSQRFLLSFDQHLPILLYGVLPQYVPSVVVDNTPFRRWSFVGPHSLWRTNVEWEWILSNQNRFGLQYNFQYGKIEGPNLKQWVQHQWFLTMSVALL
jgi:hypothetical protein